MALGYGSSSSKKHRKSRREDGSKSSVEGASKPIKTLMQAFWRRNSSSNHDTDKNSSISSNDVDSSNNTGKIPTITTTRTRTLSPSHSPVSGKVRSPGVSSLEQALRIASGQVEDPEIKDRAQLDASFGDDSVYDITNDSTVYQPPISQNGGGYLPRIPEHRETNYPESSAVQMERLKASVVRRTNSRSDRNELNSAPPGIYWPDSETSQPTQPSSQFPFRHAPVLPQTQFIDRLPRISPLSRPTSTVFYPGTRSPPVTSFCASPVRTVSPTPFLHRPLPPPPQPQQQPTAFIDRREDKMSKSFNCGGPRSGPMWQAIPPSKSPTGEIVEIIDTTVYSNVKIPLIRMASPPVGTGSSPRHSPLDHVGGSCRIRSQSPPPPKTVANQQNPYNSSTPQTQLLARDHRARQQPGHNSSRSPVVERRHRNLSPRQQTATSSNSASPALSNSPSLSSGPVMLQGNTQISHHPASPFSPIARTTPTTTLATSGGHRTVSPTASSAHSHSDATAPVPSHFPHLQHSQRNTTASPPPPPPLQTQSQSQASQSSTGFCSSGAGPSPGQMPDDVSSEYTSQGPRASRRRRDLIATYEEAWDVKMSRRLGGMDVSRLAEALPNGGGSGGDKFRRNDLTRASDRPLRSPPATVGVYRAPSLSPVLTSTEGIIMRPRVAPRTSNYRNSSNETVCNREMMASPFRLKQNRVASPTMNVSASPRPGEYASPANSDAPITDYDYAYNRSWSMGVQLNLSLNLASNADASIDQTLDHLRGSKPASPLPEASSPPPPPPHRSIMTPTLTQFSPPQSPNPMRRHRRDGPASPVSGCGSSSPPLVHQTAVSLSGVRNRGVHNPLASGVPIVTSSMSPHSPSEDSTVKGGDTSDTSATPSVNVSNPVPLPHMSRLLVDWDNMSTDSCEEPWDVRHGKVISQLTSSRFIDPSEVLSAVANGNHNGASVNGGNLYANGHSGVGEGQGNGTGVVIPPALGISPPVSCQSPLARSPSNVKIAQVQNLKPLNEQPWFHPNLTRVGAEKRLRLEPEGSFLVRNSETNKNEYSLTVKHNGFLHMRITRDSQGQFVLGEYSQPYPSIPHMISHYEQTQVPVKGADSVTLCHPR
nr:SH2 motif [Hymenolepis microstoma]